MQIPAPDDEHDRLLGLIIVGDISCLVRALDPKFRLTAR